MNERPPGYGWNINPPMTDAEAKKHMERMNKNAKKIIARGKKWLEEQ